MNIHRIIQIALFEFRAISRNFKSTAVMFILPVVFMGIFGLAFGGDISARTYNLGILKPKGKEVPVNFTILEEMLKEMQNTNDKADGKLFTVKEYHDLETAKLDDNLDIILTFATEGNSKVITYGDSYDFDYSTASGIVQRVASSIYVVGSDFYEEKSISAEVNEVTSAFDLIAPGMMVYGILIFIPGVAFNFARLTEDNYIFRYFTSQAKGYEIIFGSLITYLIFGFIQVLLLLGTALLLGFQANGSIIDSLLIAVPTMFFSVGTGLLIGALVTKTDSASNIGTIVSIILGFLSGSFISGISQVLTINVMGVTFALNDIFPSKYATDALIKILREGKSLEDVIYEFIIILVTSLLMLVAGALFYSNKRFKKLG